MKFPSLNNIISSFWKTSKRFPAAILVAVLAAGILCYLTHLEWRDHDIPHFYMWCKILMSSYLGLCLFISFSILSESRRHGVAQKVIWQLIGLGLAAGYYFSIGGLEKFNMVIFARYCLYILATHLLVAFAPFIGNGQINGFWQYNKILFLRILLAALYTSVLYGGISLALWSINELLHITINYKKYFYVWYILSCVFNTIFFLEGVPANLGELENDTSYLKGLKTFTQYVLLPLVSLYLLILYVYIGKILVEWNLPKGLVSYLVIGYSVAGIFSLLLIYPIRNNPDNRWIRIFSRWFYFALYPLIILLCVSIFDRIADYGITENRYFILVLALWLFCIASYFIIGKRENIKLIPASLCFIAVFTSFGPWGAFSVSEHSQVNHLADILAKNKILVNGKIDEKNEHPVSTDDNTQIWSVIDYLDNSGALGLLQPWFDDVKIDTLKYGVSNTLVTKMNITTKDNKEWVSIDYYAKTNRAYGLYSFDVRGFDTYSNFYGNTYAYREDTTGKEDTAALGYFMFNNDSMSIFPIKGSAMYSLKKGKKELAKLDLIGYVQKLDTLYDTTRNRAEKPNEYKEVTIPNEKFVLDVETDSLQMRFIFRQITTERKKEKIHLRQMDAGILTRRKTVRE